MIWAPSKTKPFGELIDLVLWTLLEYAVAGVAWAVGEQLVHRVLFWWDSRNQKPSTRSAKRRPRRSRKVKKEKEPDEPQATSE